MCAASSVSAGGAVGDDPAGVHERDPREEVGGQGEIVEHGNDRPVIALVQVCEQLHDLDLVADVEVSGRLVEDEDRCRLGKRQGDEDQLPLAQREASGITVAEMGDTDPFHRRLDRIPILRPRAADRWIVRQATEGDDFVDWHREWQRRQLGDDGDRSRHGLVVDIADRASPRSETDPWRGSRTPVRTRSRVDFPAPLGPIRASLSPGLERRGSHR